MSLFFQCIFRLVWIELFVFPAKPLKVLFVSFSSEYSLGLDWVIRWPRKALENLMSVFFQRIFVWSGLGDSFNLQTASTNQRIQIRNYPIQKPWRILCVFSSWEYSPSLDWVIRCPRKALESLMFVFFTEYSFGLDRVIRCLQNSVESNMSHILVKNLLVQIADLIAHPCNHIKV